MYFFDKALFQTTIALFQTIALVYCCRKTHNLNERLRKKQTRKQVLHVMSDLFLMSCMTR